MTNRRLLLSLLLLSLLLLLLLLLWLSPPPLSSFRQKYDGSKTRLPTVNSRQWFHALACWFIQDFFPKTKDLWCAKTKEMVIRMIANCCGLNRNTFLRFSITVTGIRHYLLSPPPAPPPPPTPSPSAATRII